MFQICFLYKEIEPGDFKLKVQEAIREVSIWKFSAFERRKDKPLGKETDF